MNITFLGAAGTVTGSRYLLQVAGRQVLIDCGLFQGYKQLRLKNWSPPPFDPKSIDAVVLTHAHIDHSGYIPLLVKRGFRRKVHCTPATFALCRIMLPDSGFLQEEEAKFANRHGFSKHAPALPLYTKEDAEASLDRFETRRVEEAFDVAPGVSATFHRAGHLLGAASVQIRAGDDTILFSGDLGRANDPLLKPPSPPPASDYLVVESTYGDRRHPPDEIEAELGAIIRAASARRDHRHARVCGGPRTVVVAAARPSEGERRHPGSAGLPRQSHGDRRNGTLSRVHRRAPPVVE
jgi:metallo-beta-lactamase family protein